MRRSQPRAGQGLKGSDERRWLETVEEELDNLRAAVDWSLASEGAEAALTIITALGFQGLRIEPSISSWAAMAVASPKAQSLSNFPVALAVHGWWRMNEGRLDEAVGLLEEALKALDPGEGGEAKLLLACRVLSPATGVWAMAGRNPLPPARRWLEAARAIGDAYESSLALNMVSVGMMMDRDPDAAAVATEAVEEAWRSGSPSAIAYSTFNLANALADSDPARAGQLLDQSFRSATAAENAYAATVAMGVSSAFASKQGDHEAAAGIRYQAAERSFHDGHIDHQAVQLFCVAAELAALGSAEPAAVLIGWVETIIPGQAESWKTQVGEDAAAALTSLPGELGSERYESLLSMGRGIGEIEIIRYAAQHLPSQGITEQGLLDETL